MIVRALAAGLAMLFASTALYVTAFHAPRTNGLDVAVVGSPGQAAAAQRSLGGGFDVVRYGDERRARKALLDTDVRAVLTGDRVLVAGAFGVAVADTASTALRRLAPGAAVEDVRPLPASDRRGLSPLFTVIATLIPSLAFGVLLAVAGARLPARARWAALGGFAILGGLVVAFNDDVLVGALTGHFVAIAVVAGLFVLAVSAAAHGLARLGGPRGAVVAVVVLLLLGLSSCGGALTYELEPGFYRTVSQALPPGAALTAVRNVQYFDSSATAGPLLVLGAWALGGVAAGLAGDRRRRPA